MQRKKLFIIMSTMADNIAPIALSAICAKLPEEERGGPCELLKRANDEPYIEDKIEFDQYVFK